MKRRAFVFGGLGLLGGVGAFHVYGEDLTTYAASPVGVDEDARTRAGYREPTVEPVTVAEPLPGGVGEVVVTNYLTELEKGVELAPLGKARAAVVVAISTPQVRLAGRDFNPVRDMSTDDLVALVQDSYDGLENVSRDDEGAVTVLDQPTRYARYTADATFDGVALPVDLHVTEAVETTDDLVIAVAVYPRELRALEEGIALDVIEAIVEEPPAAYDGGATGEDGADAEGGDGSTADDEAGDDLLSEVGDAVDLTDETDGLRSGDGVIGLGGGGPLA